MKNSKGPDYKAGVHTVNVMGVMVDVECEQDGGTVIQSRGQHGNPSDYFFRGWEEYKRGFGVPGKQFIHLTSSSIISLRQNLRVV